MNTISLEHIEEDKQIPIFEFRDHEWADYMRSPISIKHKFNGGVVFAGDNTGTDYFNALTFAGSHVHNLNKMVSVSEFFESNPEWYALNEKGERTSEQLCLSNTEVVDYIISVAKQWIENNPTAEIISVSQNDNVSECYCDACQQVALEEGGTSSGIYMRFVNTVAAAIKETYPDMFVEILAYQMTRGAPTNTKPADNVMIRLCCIESCFSHPLIECSHETLDSSTSGKTFIEDIKDWTAICDHVYIWDYTTNYGHYLLTYPNFDTLRQNIALYADLGVDGVFSSGNYQSTSGEFGELRCYLLAKLQWDPYMSEEEYYGHMKEFLQGVYGPGWESIFEYLNYAHEITADVHMGIKYSPEEIYGCEEIAPNPKGSIPEDLTADMIINYENTDWSKYWNWYKDYDDNCGLNNLMAKGNECFEKALASAETDEQRAEIEKIALQVKFIELYYRGLKVHAGTGSIGKILSEYKNQYSEEFEDVDFSKLRINIINYSNSQVIGKYAEDNKAFAEKCLAFNMNLIREHNYISDFEKIDFTKVTNEWYK